MAIREEDLNRIFKRLNDQNKKTAYDFLHYLVDRQRNPYSKIDQLEPDDVSLNEEEQAQLDSEDEEYVSLEDLKRELNL